MYYNKKGFILAIAITLFVWMLLIPSSEENEILKNVENEVIKKETIKETNKEDIVKKEEITEINIEEENAIEKEQKYKEIFYEFNSNESIYFDLNENEKEEEIIFDVENGVLKVEDFKREYFDTAFLKTDSFVIFRSNNQYFIGIIDYGPSDDYTTRLYTILKTHNNGQFFAYVGDIPGMLVKKTDYDSTNMESFNYKAFINENGDIEAPVRINSLLPQTWWGRGEFKYRQEDWYFEDMAKTFNEKYTPNSSASYQEDYKTNLKLKLEKNVLAYVDKDSSSEQVEIKSQQDINIKFTDNKKWIAFTVNGNEKMYWINLEETSHNIFSGFEVWD